MFVTTSLNTNSLIMKYTILFAILLCSLNSIGQVTPKKLDKKVVVLPNKSPVVTKVPVATKTEKGAGPGGRTATNIARPAAGYKINPSLTNLLNSLPAHTQMVDGKKITSKMVAVNGIGLQPVNPRPAGITQKIKPGATTSGNDQVCQTYNVKVSANSENFDVPYGTQAAHIYPGAAYMYDEYYKNTVSPKTITLERNPIYIQASASSGSGQFELVENPTSVNLNAAVGRLKASLAPTATNESTSINMVSLYDEADFSLKVNGGGGGFGFKADASFGISNNSKKSYFLIDATQTFFTLNATMPEGTGTSFFKDAANDKAVGALFMASVSYGRRVLGVLETEFKDEKMFADFKASYSGGFASGYAGLDMINGMSSASTKVKLYFVGGNAASIEVPNATEASVRSAINNFLKTTTAQNAVPIKFTFRNMAMSGMRYESATDNFTYQQCVPVMPELKYNVEVKLLTIDDSKRETVKFGIKQGVYVYAWDKIRVLDPANVAVPFLCWMDVNSTFKNLWHAEEPRTFEQSTTVNKAMTFQMSQSEMLAGAARVELQTEYIAMYATKIAGKTNDANPKKLEKVYLKDVITSGGGSLQKDVQINFNGRVFTVRWTITATPQ